MKNISAEPESIPDGVVEGRNPVLEAIRAGRKIDKLYVPAEDVDSSLRYIIAKARESGASIVEIDRRRLDAMSITRAHQGVIAQIPVREYTPLQEILDNLKAGSSPALLVVCDHITDPNNLGAILRTCDAVGCDAVVIPKRRSAGLTATVAKASAGAIEHVRVAQVANIATTLRQLKKEGFWIFGTAGTAEKSLYEMDFTIPTAVVIGSEGEGISRPALDECDFVASIPMFGRIESLNASAAAAVVLYEAVRQRRKK